MDTMPTPNLQNKKKSRSRLRCQLKNYKLFLLFGLIATAMAVSRALWVRLSEEEATATGSLSKPAPTALLPTANRKNERSELIAITAPPGLTTNIHALLKTLMSEARRGRGSGSHGRLIDLGAGVRDDDPCFPFVDAGWEALLVDGDPTQNQKWQTRFPRKDAEHNVVSYITADTVGDIIEGHGFGSDVDLLKIDIDSFDCYVMRKVLRIVRPLVVVMEVNVKYPPNVRFAMAPGFDASGSQLAFDSEKRGHVYGCSLAYQVLDLMTPNGYRLLHLDWNNAIYYDARAASVGYDGYRPPTVDASYEAGYWTRPTRRRAFSFNNEVEHWVARHLSAGDVFVQLQKLFRVDSSHRNHHIFIGNVEDAALEQGCFDSSGRLHRAEASPNGCTATKDV